MEIYCRNLFVFSDCDTIFANKPTIIYVFVFSSPLLSLFSTLQNSFAEIARLLSEFFRDLDVVPTDVLVRPPPSFLSPLTSSSPSNQSPSSSTLPRCRSHRCSYETNYHHSCHLPSNFHHRQVGLLLLRQRQQQDRRRIISQQSNNVYDFLSGVKVA